MYQQDESRADSGANFGPRLRQVDFVALRDAGANYVNLSVPGTYHVRSSSPWPQMLAHLDSMVSWAERAGLFAVISLRTGPGRGEGDITGDGLMDRSVFDNPVQRSAWVKMWRQIAERYGGRPHVVGFDLMVEPHGVARPVWRRFVRHMVAGIRTVDTRTPILVSPARWGGGDSLTGWRPFSAKKIVYTVHQYVPYGYTHGRARRYSIRQIDAVYAAMGRWLARNPGAHLAVNEFGTERHKPRAARFLKQQLERLEALGVNYAAWLWEVSDRSSPGYTPAFDFKREPAQLRAFTAIWRRNTVCPTV